mgnify:CR=1 FL=1
MIRVTVERLQVSELPCHGGYTSTPTHPTLVYPYLLQMQLPLQPPVHPTLSPGPGSPFSRFFTLREVRVMRMRWMGAASASSTPGFWAGLIAAAICKATGQDKSCSLTEHKPTCCMRQSLLQIGAALVAVPW